MAPTVLLSGPFDAARQTPHVTRCLLQAAHHLLVLVRVDPRLVVPELAVSQLSVSATGGGADEVEGLEQRLGRTGHHWGLLHLTPRLQIQTRL